MPNNVINHLTISAPSKERYCEVREKIANGDGGTCQDSVPQAIVCALEATDFEDAIRNAISIGGDSDTIGCITGSIAEALYGVPDEMRKKAMRYLDHYLSQKVDDFEELVSSNH